VSLTSIVLAAVAGWMTVGVLAAIALGRMIRQAEHRAPEADWLWDQPADNLSDAAVNLRFNAIVGGLR